MKNKEAMKSAAMKMLQNLEGLDLDNIEAINIQLVMKGKSPSKDMPCEMDEEEDKEEMSDEEKMKAIGKRKKEEDEDEED